MEKRKKLVAALRKILADVYDFESGEKYSDMIEPLPKDAVLEEGMDKSELETVLRKKPQMLQTEDGYPLWKVSNIWTNGDFEWTEEDLIQLVLDDEMSFLVYYKVNDEQFERVEERVEDMGKPDWYDKELAPRARRRKMRNV